jgi:hypothetical protein
MVTNIYIYIYFLTYCVHLAGIKEVMTARMHGVESFKITGYWAGYMSPRDMKYRRLETTA